MSIIMNTSDHLKISLIQTEVHWHNIEANLAMLEEKIWQIGEKTDLIVLPEMFNTGFTNSAAPLAEPMNSKTFRWMKQQAMQTQAVVIGSFIIKEKSQFFNRLLWMEPDGSFAFYDKKHLFRISKEHEVFSPGKERLIRIWKGWRICPLVCYDLRFPVWSRNYLDQNGELLYDLLIYVANWPAARSEAWLTLLKARAIENLSYVVGVNRVGEDGNQVAYSGNSVIADYKGDVLFSKADQEVITTHALSKPDLLAFRRKFPAYLDADPFLLREKS